MNNDILNENAGQGFASLPQQVRNLLYSEEMVNIIKTIGTKNGLHIDQIATLESDTSAVMLGIIDMHDFPNKIESHLEIDHIKADAIAQDVNDMLFVHIRDAMKEVSQSAPANSESAADSLVPSPPPPIAQEKTGLPVSTANATVSSAADTMLHEATTVVAPAATTATATSAQPAAYTSDPYREPVE